LTFRSKGRGRVEGHAKDVRRRTGEGCKGRSDEEVKSGDRMD